MDTPIETVTLSEEPQTPILEAEAETPSPETPAEAPSEQPKVEEDKRLGRAFAQLSRKEQALVKKERELKARLSALEEEAKFAKEYRDLQEALKKDPLANLEKLGLTYEQLIKAGIEADRNPVESKLEALERKLAEREAAEAQARKQWEETQKAQSFQAEVARGMGIVDNFLKSQPEQYELSISNDYSRKEILEVYSAAYDESLKQGIEISQEGAEQLMKKACDEYENYLQTKLEQQLEFIKKTKKFSSRFNTQKESAKEISIPETKTPEITSKTLTNNLTKSGVAKVSNINYTNDDDVIEEMTRLLRIANGKEKG